MQKHDSRVAAWWTVRILVAILVPVIGSYTLLEPFGRDQGIHATIAFALDEGLVTYRDVFNMKPPMTTAMHWLSQAVFGHSLMAIRALDLVAATFVALGLIEIGKQLGRTPVFGIASAIGFAVLYYSFGFWEHSQTDGWAGFLVVPAVMLMLWAWARPNGRSRFAAMFCAGAILGVAFCFKYTIGGMGALVFTPLIANLLGKDDIRFYLRDFWACVMGGAATLVVVVGTLVIVGAWPDYTQIQEFVMGYVGYKTPNTLRLVTGFMLPGMLSTFAIGAVFVGVLCVVAEWSRSKQAIVLVMCVLWILAGWVSGAVQGKGFTYHYLPLVPVYAILIGVTVEYFSKLADNRQRSYGIAFLLSLLLFVPSRAAEMNARGIKAFAAESRDGVYIANLAVTSDFDFLGTVEFAKTLKKHHAPDDTLFVWGYETMLYFMAETPPRYKYPYSWPFLNSHYEGQYDQDLISRLKAVPPTHIVVQTQDATPWVTGNPSSSEEHLLQFPELKEFIDARYRLIEQHPRFKLLELTGAK